MSTSSEDSLSDDVLSKIFENLGFHDLRSCTNVCRKWRCIIELLVLGRRYFQRRKKSSAAWRRAWRKMAMDETNLEPEDYKNICWSCLQYVEQVDNNWRTGSYKIKSSVSSSLIEIKFAVGDDFITACDDMPQYVHIFDRESVELKRIFRPDCPEYQITDLNTVVYPEDKKLTFHYANTGQLIRRIKVDESPFFRFDACCPTAKLLTVVSLLDHVLRLDLLRVDNASTVARIKTVEVARPGRNEFKVDEQFILHQHPIADNPKCEITTCHFISTGIVHSSGLERSLTVKMRFEYDRGLMFIISDGLIRILDVASGTYLHDIHMSKFLLIKSIRVNSNYVVIVGEVYLYVYSLQTLKNPLASEALVFKINHNYKKLIDVLVDGTQIVCLGVKYFNFSAKQITVFDFGSFDFTPITTLDAP